MGHVLLVVSTASKCPTFTGLDQDGDSFSCGLIELELEMSRMNHSAQVLHRVKTTRDALEVLK